MTDDPQPTPADSWSLTDKAAIILKSYGVDDPEAARAVVALVLEDAAQCADYFADMDYASMHYPEGDGMAASRTAYEIAFAIRALMPDYPHTASNTATNRAPAASVAGVSRSE